MDLPAFFSTWLGLSKDTQQQAAITGTFQMLGVLITGALAVATFALTQWATRRRDDRLHQAGIERDEQRRRERARDLQLALRAEITVFASKYADFDLDAHRDAILKKIHDTTGKPGSEFTPFTPKMTDQFVWTAVAEDIPILPGSVIDAVVLYYNMLKAIGLLIDDMRSEAFRKLEPTRKAAIYDDYVKMLEKLAYHSTHAIDALNAELEAPDGQ